MKETISRTIVTTIVEYVHVEVKDGKATTSNIYTVEFTGKKTPKEVDKELKKVMEKPATVVDISEKKETYEMPLFEFIQNSTIVKKEND